MNLKNKEGGNKMSLKKTHKTKKVKKMRGRNMGTHGWGARKKHRKSGHRGGVGMAGSGKRGDAKKTLVQKLYGHNYFGKQGVTSRGTQKDKTDKINLRDIQKKYAPGKVELKNYKILGEGELKGKFTIHAKAASKTAMEKVKKAGGEIILPEIKKEEIKEKKTEEKAKAKKEVKKK